MTRRAFLHIGLPKTGTTYLQAALWHNKAALAEAGLLLPGESRRRHLLASLDIREDPKLDRRAGDVTQPWQDLADEAAQWSGEVVISHEFFAAASPAQVRRIVETLPDYEVHAILTARSMTGLGRSRWQEWIKNGAQRRIDDYPPTDAYDPADEWGWGSFDLDDILTRWASALPPAHIHVLPLEATASDPQELWRRFAGVLGLDPLAFDVEDEPANTALGLVEIELLRRVNKRLDQDFTTAHDRGHWIRGYLAEGGILRRRRERFKAGEAKEQDLRTRGLRAITQLRLGGFDVVGDLGHLEPSALDARHPDEVTDRELLNSATLAIANLVRDVRRRDLEMQTLRTELEELSAREQSAPRRLPRVRRRLRRKRSTTR